MYDLNLVYTYRCNITCRHCISNCGPQRREVMGVRRARQHVDALAVAKELRTVGVTGGEPFMYHADLVQLMQYVSERYRLPLGVVTNCYWAHSEAAARRKLEPLHAAGLRTITVSCDDYHLEHIDPRCVRNAVACAAGLGIFVTINIVVRQGGSVGKPSVLARLGLLGQIDPDQVELKEYGIIPVGRSTAAISPDERFVDGPLYRNR